MQLYEIQQQLARELGPGEHLLWSGRARQGLMLRASDAFMIPFSLMWGGFAIFWEASVIQSGAPLFFMLWGVPFVLIGLYLIVGRFFADARARERTIYGLTNERVLIISGLFKTSVKSLSLRTLSDVSLSERGDGTGTITLGPSGAGAWFGNSSWPGSRQHMPPALEGIPDVRSVYQSIRAAQKAAT